MGVLGMLGGHVGHDGWGMGGLRQESGGGVGGLNQPILGISAQNYIRTRVLEYSEHNSFLRFGQNSL